MLLVILGAGSSYDSIDPALFDPGDIEGTAFRPPLARELFDQRPASFGPMMQRLPECIPVASRLRRAIHNGEGVEDALRQIERDDGETELGQRQLTALRFYLQDALWQVGDHWANKAFGATYFVELCDAIEKWRLRSNERVIYVTFNYDLLLEGGLRGLSLRLDQIDDYVAGPHTKVFKLHGSANWGRVIAAPRVIDPRGVRAEIINRAPDLLKQLTERYEVMSDAEQESTAREGILMYPAVALPVARKEIFECPSTHVQALTDLMPQVSGVLMIGWRAQEANFIKMLSVIRKSASVYGVVPRSSQDEVVERLQDALGARPIRFSADTFTDFMAAPGALTDVLAATAIHRRSVSA